MKNKTGLKGFEPLTYGLRVRRSTELSYKPAKLTQINGTLREINLSKSPVFHHFSPVLV
jgi:hypothetical protein